MSKKPVALIILDGCGAREERYGNAVAAANTPEMNRIFNSNPMVTIGASGMDVGLPEGQMGNSEVGHTNMGAGRVVYQELTRITKSITDGDFFCNPALVGAVENCLQNGTALHLCGLLSDGGVHSHNTHLYALLELAKKMGLHKVFVHCFMDGRDVPPSSGKDFVAALLDKMSTLGVGSIATISGRYYAMDRDNRWERVVQAYDAMVNGKGGFCADPVKVMTDSYADGITDEFVKPTICTPNAEISPHDSVIFFNFRPDRAREITRTMVDEAFTGFARVKGYFPLHYVCLTQYDVTMPHVQVAFQPQSLDNTFGAYIADKGLTQLRIAETEKYAHVTFFFNGGVEAPCKNEDRALIPSPKVATYDLKPEMSAYEVTEEVLARLDSGRYDVVILNFANCDMVGHTGVFEAAVKAVEAVDSCLGKVVAKIESMGGAALITADHGNADQMYEPDGSPFTAHTLSPVPLVLVGGKGRKLALGGRLADLAPTLLELLELPQPTEMDGKSLLR
ncbi:MAG: 2,3-bisphosphoglycerate-independent phosphoglycerate mutase [Angelakisella sp.]